MTMHATIHFSPCNIMRLASAHKVNSAKTTCRKEGHHCESGTERGNQELALALSPALFSAWLKSQYFSAVQFSSCEKGNKHLLLAVPSGSSTAPSSYTVPAFSSHTSCSLPQLPRATLLLPPHSLQTLKPPWQLLKKKKKYLRFMSSQVYWSSRLHLRETPSEAGSHLLNRSRIMHIAKGLRIVYIKRKKNPHTRLDSCQAGCNKITHLSLLLSNRGNGCRTWHTTFTSSIEHFGNVPGVND